MLARDGAGAATHVAGGGRSHVLEPGRTRRSTGVVMNKWLKRVGIVLGVIVVLIGIGVGAAYAASVSREGATYDVEGASFEIPGDPASLAEGERLFIARGCGGTDCHAADGGGHVMMHDGPFGTISAANLTRATREYTSADWDRAVRHGIGRSGTSLIFMPSGDFVGMSDRELARIAAYVRSLPEVDRDLPPTDVAMLPRMIDLAGMFVLFPAAAIDHGAVAEPDPAPGRTVEYGAYLARLCTGCHGEHLSGGPIPGAPPELGTPLNLTSHETGLAGWTEEQFRTVLREGRTPSGHQVAPEQMPYPALGRMTDDEIGALWMYLQTVEPMPEGSR